ncbi:hypothetical protein SAMN06296065_101191 [Novosphingobium panipatense]|uniref:Secreted protein n=1 Tax=Novosphingobium panipatense TaxID=428991 RepID=A0ABY1Q0Z4_9SPHN|nr:hypothetical protein SAMN06296065_101191 [Novosphingobium panipatense]
MQRRAFCFFQVPAVRTMICMKPFLLGGAVLQWPHVSALYHDLQPLWRHSFVLEGGRLQLPWTV